MYYRDDLDTLANILGRTNTIYFTDEFIDPWWSAFGSKGVSDPDVNYFYVYTTVDSNEATSELTGSPYPSNCVAEFDQDIINPAVAGSRNILSYVTDHRYGDGSVPTGVEISEGITGALTFNTWNFSTQNWVTQASYFAGYGWYETGDASLDLGMVFMVDLDPSAPDQMFSTYEPGLIATDDDISHPMGGTYDGEGRPYRYWMMVPMERSYIMKSSGMYADPGDPLQYSHIGQNIQDENGDEYACTAILVWNVNTQQVSTASTYYPDYDMWYDFVSDEALPGHVICIVVEADFEWL